METIEIEYNTRYGLIDKLEDLYHNDYLNVLNYTERMNLAKLIGKIEFAIEENIYKNFNDEFTYANKVYVLVKI